MRMNLAILALLCICYVGKKSTANLSSSTYEPQILVSGPPTFEIDPRIQENGTLSLLGYGYDITGKYAHISAVRRQVINMSAYDIKHPNRILFRLAWKLDRILLMLKMQRDLRNNYLPG
jgi:hypothetical protein